MSRLRNFIIGYGKSLELFPDIGFIAIKRLIYSRRRFYADNNRYSR